VSTECGARPVDGEVVDVDELKRNDLLFSARTPGFRPSWNRIIATDADTVTFVNGARVTKKWLGSTITVFRPTVVPT